MTVAKLFRVPRTRGVLKVREEQADGEGRRGGGKSYRSLWVAVRSKNRNIRVVRRLCICMFHANRCRPFRGSQLRTAPGSYRELRTADRRTSS